MCEHKSTENASSQSKPCAKISTKSDNRSSVVNLSRRIALAPRTSRRSRPHGAHRGGLGLARRSRISSSFNADCSPHLSGTLVGSLFKLGHRLELGGLRLFGISSILLRGVRPSIRTKAATEVKFLFQSP